MAASYLEVTASPLPTEVLSTKRLSLTVFSHPIPNQMHLKFYQKKGGFFLFSFSQSQVL
jgi:hypothetical protein